MNNEDLYIVRSETKIIDKEWINDFSTEQEAKDHAAGMNALGHPCYVQFIPAGTPIPN